MWAVSVVAVAPIAVEAEDAIAFRKLGFAKLRVDRHSPRLSSMFVAAAINMVKSKELKVIVAAASTGKGAMAVVRQHFKAEFLSVTRACSSRISGYTRFAYRPNSDAVSLVRWEKHARRRIGCVALRARPSFRRLDRFPPLSEVAFSGAVASAVFGIFQCVIKSVGTDLEFGIAVNTYARQQYPDFRNTIPADVLHGAGVRTVFLGRSDCDRKRLAALKTLPDQTTRIGVSHDMNLSQEGCVVVRAELALTALARPASFYQYRE